MVSLTRCWHHESETTSSVQLRLWWRSAGRFRGCSVINVCLRHGRVFLTVFVRFLGQKMAQVRHNPWGKAGIVRWKVWCRQPTVRCSKAFRVEAIALRVEAIAMKLKATTFRLEAIAIGFLLLLGWRPLLVGTRTLLGAPGLTTRRKKLLGAPWHRY